MTKLHKMIRFLFAFRTDQSGAVTIDWVVLTAVVIGLGLTIVVSVAGSSLTLADDLSGAVGELLPRAAPPPVTPLG